MYEGFDQLPPEVQDAVQKIAREISCASALATAELLRDNGHIEAANFIGEKLNASMPADVIVAAGNQYEHSMKMLRKYLLADADMRHIDPDDLRVAVVWADDQIANEGPRGVQIEHIPTGIVCRRDDAGSQLANRELAIGDLREKLDNQ